GNSEQRDGLAWYVADEGRTAIREDADIYHDTAGPFNSSFGIAATSHPFAPNTTLTSPAFPRPSSLTGGTIARSARTIDYHIKQPYGVTYNVTAQRDLTGQLA